MRKPLMWLLFFAIPSLSSASPGHFTATLYSEALGRAPEAVALENIQNELAIDCSVLRQREIIRSFFASEEYTSHNYPAAAKTITLYRTILQRDPAQPGFDYFADFFAKGGTAAGAADLLSATAAFRYEMAPRNCDANTSGWYGTAVTGLQGLRMTYQGFPTDQTQSLVTAAEVQAALDALPAGGILQLDQGIVVTVDQPIVVSDGRTLTTYSPEGSIPMYQYARMARLVRTSHFNDGSGNNEAASAMVRLDNGGGISSLWLDGNRQGLGVSRTSVNVVGVGGVTNEFVVNTRQNDSAGWSHIYFSGFTDNPDNDLATGNLITGYTANPMVEGDWTDGISNAGTSSTIAHNTIIDATDVAIIVFRPEYLFDNQRSQIFGNYIVQAGHSAFGGLVTDGLGWSEWLYTSGTLPDYDEWQDTLGVDFEGTRFTDNVLYTSQTAHFQVVLSNGTHNWGYWRKNVPYGAEFTNNNTGQGYARAAFGEVVSGMQDPIMNNILDVRLNDEHAPADLLGQDFSAARAYDYEPWAPSDTPEGWDRMLLGPWEYDRGFATIGWCPDCTP